jgi:hypothetical protein
MRKITIFQSQTSESQILEVEDSVKTWGELRPLIEFDLENKKVVVQQTSVTLDLPEAVLPDGDLTLFIFVSQSKAGAAGIDYSTRDGQRAILKEITDVNIRRTIRRHNDKGATNINTELPTKEQRKLFAAHFKAPAKSSGRKTLSNIEKPAKAVARKKAPVKKKAAKKKPEISQGGGKEFFQKPSTKQENSAEMDEDNENINITLNVGQGKVIAKLDKISERMDDAISRLEELPNMIADKIKETSKIVKAAKELQQEAKRIKHQLRL